MDTKLPEPEVLFKAKLKKMLQGKGKDIESSLALSLKDFLNSLKEQWEDDLYKIIIHSGYFKKHFTEEWDLAGEWLKEEMGSDANQLDKEDQETKPEMEMVTVEEPDSKSICYVIK